MKNWRSFTEQAATAMTQFSEGKIDLSDAYKILEEYKSADFYDIVEYVENTISEIDAAPGWYSELLYFLRLSPSEAEMRAHMDSSIFR